MKTLLKTSPLERENFEMVVEQLILRLKARFTNIINFHLENYQRDESELDRSAKKLVLLLQNVCLPRKQLVKNQTHLSYQILSQIIFHTMTVKLSGDTAAGNAR